MYLLELHIDISKNSLLSFINKENKIIDSKYKKNEILKEFSSFFIAHYGKQQEEEEEEDISKLNLIQETQFRRFKYSSLPVPRNWILILFQYSIELKKRLEEEEEEEEAKEEKKSSSLELLDFVFFIQFNSFYFFQNIIKNSC